MDWEKEFSVSNHSGMRVIYGVIDIADGTDSYIINPLHYGEETIERIKGFVKRGIINVTNDFEVPLVVDKSKEISVKKVSSTANEYGDKHDHVVYDPFVQETTKSFSVQEIDMGKSFTEEAIDTSAVGIVVEAPKPTASSERISKEEAIDLINLQWKKFESAINKIDDVRKLNFLQVVALENGASEKKQEIIANRLAQL